MCVCVIDREKERGRERERERYRKIDKFIAKCKNTFMDKMTCKNLLLHIIVVKEKKIYRDIFASFTTAF